MTAGKSHILIIEDNEDILNMLKAMLEMKGYSVSTRLNVFEVEASIKELAPDAILMDMLLSGVDGREICKLLKAHHDELAKIPVIMISAHPNAKKECLEAGADYFLEKPFDMEVFFKLIDKALNKEDK
jgi:DNA-binding response OmpR family regulator